MFNVRQIVRNNNATFYDFETRKRRSQKLRLVLTAGAALFAAVSFPSVSDNLLAGFLAVQSILLGFTVNVMFFLLSNRETKEPKADSIEAELRSERLHDLYHELFYNVSYFNLIAVVSIIVATSLLLPTPEVPSFLRGISLIERYVAWLGSSNLPAFAMMIFRVIATFVFYALAIEVIYSIARVIGRTTFYFEQKMGQVREPKEN